MKKIVISLVLLSSIGMNAQEQKHQISVHGSGFFAKQNTTPSSNEDRSDYNYNAGLGYRYYINPKWSIGTGIEYQSFETASSLSNLSDSYNTTDINGDAFEFRYSIANYREKQTVHNLAIPLNVQFETSGVTAWYANIGMKAGFNLSAKYQTEINHLTTSGYFPEWNVELKDPLFMGFGEWNDINSQKQNLKLKTAFMLTAETGVKQRIANNSNIYIGFYIHYGLNNLKENKENQNLIGYNINQPIEFILPSLLHANNTNENAYISSYKLISYGLKIQWALGL